MRLSRWRTRGNTSSPKDAIDCIFGQPDRMNWLTPARLNSINAAAISSAPPTSASAGAPWDRTSPSYYGEIYRAGVCSIEFPASESEIDTVGSETYFNSCASPIPNGSAAQFAGRGNAREAVSSPAVFELQNLPASPHFLIASWELAA
jgi:hypothetical protein